MAQTIKQRDYLFRERPRRTRPAFAIMLLGITSLIAAGVTEGTAGDDTANKDDPDTAMTETLRVYGAVGGPERFVLSKDDDGPMIRFLCRQAESECEDGAPTRLREAKAADARVLLDEAGRPVLTIAVRGARLHAGSEVVPETVPDKGRAMLPTTAADVAPRA